VADHPIEDLLARLERERQAADRLYNDALTAVDRAIQQAPAFPAPGAPYDDSQLPRLALEANILPGGAPPPDRSLKGRLRDFIWRLVGPPIEAQQRFNAAIVEHASRSLDAQRRAHEAAGRMLDEVRREFERLASFESLLIQYLQTITPYVDSRDRRWGSADLWERLALAEQRLSALKREIADRQGSPATSPTAGNPSAPSTGSRDAYGLAADRSASGDAFAANLDSATYVGFEGLFRGPQGEIRARVQDYVPIFASATDVVDIGCGRGELLELFREQGITARGVDANHAMVQLCRERGLRVEQGDAVSFLERQEDETLGGLVAIQVVEHFEPAYLLRFLEAAHHKLRPGASIVLETINPACWVAFFECYLRDVTHRQALHPDTLRYLVQAAGFTQVDVHYRQMLDETYRLERVPDGTSDNSAAGDARLAAVVSTVNAHADKLNARLFSSMDYAVVARREKA
jgi:2-polyprenyl-3-methyl-5-hydroxy-6-metoxy-1,4-benzoquinol methylase